MFAAKSEMKASREDSSVVEISKFYEYDIIKSIKCNIQASLIKYHALKGCCKSIGLFSIPKHITDLENFWRKWNYKKEPYNKLETLLKNLNAIVSFETINHNVNSSQARWQAIENLDYYYELKLLKLFQDHRLKIPGNLMNLLYWIKTSNKGKLFQRNPRSLEVLFTLIKKYLEKDPKEPIQLPIEFNIYAKSLFNFINKLEKFLPKALDDEILLLQLFAYPSLTTIINIEPSQKEGFMIVIRFSTMSEIVKEERYALTIDNLQTAMDNLVEQHQKILEVIEKDDLIDPIAICEKAFPKL